MTTLKEIEQTLIPNSFNNVVFRVANTVQDKAIFNAFIDRFFNKSQFKIVRRYRANNRKDKKECFSDVAARDADSLAVYIQRRK